MRHEPRRGFWVPILSQGLEQMNLGGKLALESIPEEAKSTELTVYLEKIGWRMSAIKFHPRSSVGKRMDIISARKNYRGGCRLKSQFDHYLEKNNGKRSAVRSTGNCRKFEF